LHRFALNNRLLLLDDPEWIEAAAYKELKGANYEDVTLLIQYCSCCWHCISHSRL